MVADVNVIWCGSRAIDSRHTSMYILQIYTLWAGAELYSATAIATATATATAATATRPACTRATHSMCMARQARASSSRVQQYRRSQYKHLEPDAILRRLLQAGRLEEPRRWLELATVRYRRTYVPGNLRSNRHRWRECAKN